MASGSKLVLPMVVLNMGGEMVNILHQRLNAQLVEGEKGNAVLRDVVRTMYAPKVIKSKILLVSSIVCVSCTCVQQDRAMPSEHDRRAQGGNVSKVAGIIVT